jgi:hypothetical protein
MKLATDFDYKKLGARLGHFVLTNRISVTSIVLLVAGSIAVQRITHLTKPETDDSHLNQQLSTLQVVKFDEEAIEKIEKLKGSNIEITSDFTSRNNPFDE